MTKSLREIDFLNFSILNVCKIVLLASLMVCFQAISVNAKTVHLSKSVGSGKTVRIDTFQGWNNNCSHKIIKIDIVTNPKAGQASAKIVNSKITNAHAGSAGKCVGRKIRGLGVYYKSKTGYRGRDKVKIKMKVSGQAPVFFVYRITVR